MKDEKVCFHLQKRRLRWEMTLMGFYKEMDNRKIGFDHVMEEENGMNLREEKSVLSGIT
jgi:hypothetical protein